MSISQPRWTCSLCGMSFNSSIQPAGTCAMEGCNEPICNICWSVRGRKLCRAHSTIEHSEKPNTSVESLANLTIDYTGVNSFQARSLELAFVSRFDINVKQMLDDWREQGYGYSQKRHRSLDELNIIRRMQECKLTISQIRDSFPLNLSSLYQLIERKPKMWAKSKKDEVMLEGRGCARLAKYVLDGQDSNPQTLDVLTFLINSMTKSSLNWKNIKLWVIGLFSPAGWDQTSISYVCGNKVNPAFIHSTISLCLIGPKIDDLMFNHNDEKLKPFIKCFEARTIGEKICECKSRLADDLLVEKYVVLDGFAQRTGINSGVIENACNEILQENRDAEIVQTDSLGKILRVKEVLR